VRGATQVGDATGQRCDQLLTPEQAGDPDGFGTGGSDVTATASGVPTEGLSWGFAPPDTEEGWVLFSDGSREQAAVAVGQSVPAPLWSIAYVGVDVQAVEARRAGEVIPGRTPATDVPDDGTAATPQAVFGDRLLRVRGLFPHGTTSDR
jgi:hypothetical protein